MMTAHIHVQLPTCVLVQAHVLCASTRAHTNTYRIRVQLQMQMQVHMSLFMYTDIDMSVLSTRDNTYQQSPRCFHV